LFDTPPGFDHQQIEVGDYNGLLFVEGLARDTGQTGRILTAWRDKRAYDAAAQRFITERNLAEFDAPWEGFHLGTCVPKRSLWRRVPYARLWAVVTVIFLALGYADTIRDRFGAPRVEPLVSAAPQDFLLGDPIRFDTVVRNTAEIGHCNVEFLKHS